MPPSIDAVALPSTDAVEKLPAEELALDGFLRLIFILSPLSSIDVIAWCSTVVPADGDNDDETADDNDEGDAELLVDEEDNPSVTDTTPLILSSDSVADSPTTGRRQQHVYLP